MKKRIAINGFGRIGRAVFKIILSEHPKLEVVAVNDLTDLDTIVHLLKYDSVYGRYEEKVSIKEGALEIGEGEGLRKISFLSEKEPSLLPWEDLSVDVVLECTGLFTEFEKARKHLDAGAKKVIISAPSKSPENIDSFVLGVNEETYDNEKNHVVDMGSCTTNCIAPVLKILEDKFGLEKANFNTVHSYTADQNLQDGPHKDLRRARAAAINIIPTTTGAAKAVSRVVPELEGKVEGVAMRVPTSTVSVVDVSCLLKNSAEREEINDALKEASGGRMNGVLHVEEDPLVSTDYIKSPYASIVDAQMTGVNDNFARVIAWYDNEWGYSHRLADFAKYVGNKL